jgi:hypothetical protein
MTALVRGLVVGTLLAILAYGIADNLAAPYEQQFYFRGLQ